MALADNLQTFGKRWAALRNERSGELPTLDQFSGRPGTHEYFTQLQKPWGETLKALANLPKRKRTALVEAESSVASALLAVNFILSNRNNGIQWLLDRGLIQFLVVAEGQFQLLRQRIGEERQALVDAYKAELGASAKLILDAEAQSKAIAELHEQGKRHLGEIESGVEKANQAEERIEELRPLWEESQELAQGAQSALDSINGAASAAALVQKKLNTLETEGQNQLTSSENKLRLASDNLSDALRSVKQQGLAGAFAEKAIAAKRHLDGEKRIFAIAILYLVLVAAFSVGLALRQGYPATFEAWAVRLAQMIALAAPGIWIGWITARRMAALSQIFSDYEYKSATALAFEGYKKEVTDTDDPELLKSLLSLAVKTFGENPTHYYDRTKNDPHHPAESLADGVRDGVSKGIAKVKKKIAGEEVEE